MLATILFIIVYSFIALIVGRAWKTACARRKDDFFGPMYAAVGFFWVPMIVVLPLAILIGAVCQYLIVPFASWVMRYVDIAVAYVIPEKAS